VANKTFIIPSNLRVELIRYVNASFMPNEKGFLMKLVNAPFLSVQDKFTFNALLARLNRMNQAIRNSEAA
jgi:hypothetical protein